jgi:hypothetical protein
MRICTFLFLVAICLAGCRKEDTITNVNPVSPVFRIDLMSTFKSDSVRVSIDQVIVFADTVSTKPTMGYSNSFYPSVTTGSHTISVDILNEHIKADTTLYISDTTLVLVNYDRTPKRISFAKYSFLVMYF